MASESVFTATVVSSLYGQPLSAEALPAVDGKQQVGSTQLPAVECGLA
jgi:hypothetical protein